MHWRRRGARDGLDMVLSMSSRQPWLWQSLILSSQFEKSENKGERDREREREREGEERRKERSGSVRAGEKVVSQIRLLLVWSVSSLTMGKN